MSAAFWRIKVHSRNTQEVNVSNSDLFVWVKHVDKAVNVGPDKQLVVRVLGRVIFIIHFHICLSYNLIGNLLLLKWKY